ncbi:MAG: RnfH family protein [Gammaproteobacteria bacterium]
MNIGVAYNGTNKQFWLKIEVANDCIAIDAINQSGILAKCPEIDIEACKIGVFGKFVKQDTPLKEGDRVEIYRPITADPKTVPRRDLDDDD